MQLRPVEYVPHEPVAPELVENYVMVECLPEGWVRHAVLIPRAWVPVPSLPIDDDPTAPLLASMFIEDPKLQSESCIAVVGGVPADWGDSAEAVATRLAARDGLQPYRWNDEDADVGGARAMVANDDRIGGIRVLPLEREHPSDSVPGWVFFACIGPKSRFQEYGGALSYGLLSFRVHPSARWATG